MNRRVLEDRINLDVPLAQLGVDANLIYDRIITITDDAGLAPGEPFIIKAQCFPFMEEMDAERLTNGLRSLAEHGFICYRSWDGRKVLSVNPDAFKKVQRLRSDYTRRFNFGELSQVVYLQGLPGFRSAPERHPNGSCTEIVHTSSILPPDYSTDISPKLPSADAEDGPEIEVQTPRPLVDPNPPADDLDLLAPKPIPEPEPKAVPPPTNGTPKKTKDKATNPNHKPLVEYWMHEWDRRNGRAYAFLGAKDGTAITTILAAVGNDLDDAKRTIDAYLLDKDDFVGKNAHSLGMLASQVNRWTPRKHAGDEFQSITKSICYGKTT